MTERRRYEDIPVLWQWSLFLIFSNFLCTDTPLIKRRNSEMYDGLFTMRDEIP
jgi:hypothetical protein